MGACGFVGNAALAGHRERDFGRQLMVAGRAGLFLVPDRLQLLNTPDGFGGSRP